MFKSTQHPTNNPPANGRVFILDYLTSITVTCFINLHFVEAPGIEALIEYKT